MQRSNYRSLSNLAPQEEVSDVNNPLTYCLNNTMSKSFLHGGNASIYGQNSRPCQSFLSDYCSQHWDSACEIASKNSRVYMPNNLANGNISGRTYSLKGLTSGEVLIRNTAAKKYMVSLGNCVPKFEPFDPLVSNSPMIQYWISETGTNDCVPVYGVDPATIDGDVVMNKILEKPNIALDILINIYNTHKRAGLLEDLKGTRLGDFFFSNPMIFM